MVLKKSKRNFNNPYDCISNSIGNSYMLSPYSYI